MNKKNMATVALATVAILSFVAMMSGADESAQFIATNLTNAGGCGFGVSLLGIAKIFA